jgi:hypothetical protein
MIAGIVALSAAGAVGCVTASGDETVDPDEPVATTGDDDDDDGNGDDDDATGGGDSTSNIASAGDDDDDDSDDDDDGGDGTSSDDDDDDGTDVVTSPGDFVGTETLTSDVPATGAPQCPNLPNWAAVNGGGPMTPVTQADITLECQQMGAGLVAGFVRFGCNAVMRDGSGHYGMVLGWWQVLRRDGARSPAKNLNFREGGYDMAFDVLAADAAGGIVMQPAPHLTSVASRR